MKVALVYDYLTQMGGGERVVMALHEIFPDAPLYTVVYDPDAVADEFRGMDIRTSFVNRLPFSHRRFELYLPLYGWAMEQFDLREYDVVLSVSTMVSKGVVTGPRTCHISICFTPMRWAWDLYHNYLEELKDARFVRWAFRFWTHYYRIWDVASASRVNYFVAGSEVAAQRIRKHYNRDSDVIYPPVAVDRFESSGQPPEDFYLVVSRLVYAKRIDLVVDAFAKLDRPLVVIGQGDRLASLRKKATPNVTFLGYQSDEVVRDYYSRCRALVFPGEEDFGLTPVEAMASGRPVIAYAAGGLTETVVDGETGVFFLEQTPQALRDAVSRFESMKFAPDRLRSHSESFGRRLFERRIRKFVEEKHHEYIESNFGLPSPKNR